MICKIKKTPFARLYFKKVLVFVKQYLYVFVIGLNFLLLDLIYRHTTIDSAPIVITYTTAISAAIICLFLISIILFKKKIGKYIYIILISLFTAFCVISLVFERLFAVPFSFNTLDYFSEGSRYFLDIINIIPVVAYIIVIISTMSVFLVCRFLYNQNSKTDYLVTLLLIILAIGLGFRANNQLGEAVDGLAWDSWSTTRNIYNDCNNKQRCLRISGIYRYVIKDFVMTYFPDRRLVNEMRVFLEEEFTRRNNEEINPVNEYTGILNDQNLIVILLESIDRRLISDDRTPNIAKLMNEGINFTNAYAINYGGGATFNSEFAVNTGLFTPFKYGRSLSSFHTNDFPYALPHLFRKKGYTANSFHFNDPHFYNRAAVHNQLGFEEHFSYLEIKGNWDGVFDTELIDAFYEQIAPEDKLFYSFIITYSAHTPYTMSNNRCHSANNPTDEVDPEENEELYCLISQIRETDMAIGNLINKLESDNLLGDTSIIIFTDHNAIGFTDQEELNKLSEVDVEHELNNIRVPLAIWSNRLVAKEVDKVMSHADLFATIVNLFDLDKPKRYMISNDALNTHTPNAIVRHDLTWYDGNIFYRGSGKVEGGFADPYLIKLHNNWINTRIKINEAIFITNYFRK